ncbi:hypothetical protein O181_061248 [Austropuccinia psidii MF-1]|uniref:Uncharacterized protein n=1 Tax=Austropuccinia psidii MF-1 TaxID=1389203 RepID=A0A9Q3EMF8_9BASI|nr:hypothetical protein [Austropuccinia psidii MF-1]
MFITLLDPQQAICTTQINHGEDRRTIKDIKKLVHRRNRILDLPSHSIEFAVINTQTEATIFFLAKTTGAPVAEELGQMKPFSTFSEMYALSVSDSWFDKEYITPTGGRDPSSSI